MRVGSFLAVDSETELRSQGCALGVGQVRANSRWHDVGGPSECDPISLVNGEEVKARRAGGLTNRALQSAS